jgi:hypothetical protein
MYPVEMLSTRVLVLLPLKPIARMYHAALTTELQFSPRGPVVLCTHVLYPVDALKDVS